MSTKPEKGCFEGENTLAEVPVRAVADLAEGTRIHRYIIVGLIGKGGMGAVYKAYDPELDRRIAIKVMTLAPQEGESASQPRVRLMREAQALARLNHANVVAVYDVGNYEEGVYIAMEFVEGKTLRDWISEDEPSQKEILATMVAAGRGLQAAHSAGIVHRDFKPENLLIGGDGHAKVLDFGLARAADFDIATTRTQKVTRPDTEALDHYLSQPVTQVGAMIGTVAYMAPEHFGQQELDEKTDQFSFCVTLFEALYGQRPFAGETLEEFEGNVTNGRIQIPDTSSVPKWIEDILRQGLSVPKESRYASLTDILEALGHDPLLARAQRQKRLYLGLAFVLAAVMFLGIGYILFDRSQVCTGATKKTASLWNAQKKTRLSQSFVNTGLSYAEDSAHRVANLIDEYLTHWATEYTETCEATRVRAEQSEENMDLKLGCLNKHLIRVAALINVLGQADNTVVEKAIQAVSSISSVSDCSDVASLKSKIPPPKDGKTRNQVIALRKQLAEIEAYSNTGKYRQGLALAKQLEQKTNQVDYLPIQARASYWLGRLLARSGEYQQAQSVLEKAALAAGNSKDALLAAKAMAWLVRVVGYRQGRQKAGLSIALDAKVMLGIAGGNQFVQALLLTNMGLLYYNKGDYQKAIENVQKALTIHESIHGPQHPNVASAYGNMGSLLYIQGDYQKAQECYLKALAIHRKTLGSEHPHVATSLNNLGMVYREQGQFTKAKEYQVKALTIREKVLGPTHPLVAQSLHNLAISLQGQGEIDQALQHHYRSLKIREKSLGPSHHILSWPLSSIGNLLFEKGSPKEAIKPLERAVKICENTKCQPQAHGLCLFDLARVLVATKGDKQRAINLAQQARDVFGQVPKALHKQRSNVEKWLQTMSRRGLAASNRQ